MTSDDRLSSGAQAHVAQRGSPVVVEPSQEALPALRRPPAALLAKARAEQSKGQLVNILQVSKL